MKKIILIAVVLLLGNVFTTFAQNYVYEIDLVNVKHDRVLIKLNPPKIKEGKAVFVMPSVIPGSYARKDYGRFVHNFAAYDKDGNKLKVKRKKTNNFYISGADKLAKVEYWVSDTWDDTDLKRRVFEPGGSNIEANKNFVINHHAFVGYFENYKMQPFELRFTKPEKMYGSTPLKRKTVNAKKDVFYADNYVELVDNPLMYCEPDTLSFKIRNTTVYVSSYSSNKKVKAAQLVPYLMPTSEALGNFFGTLPVDQYHFILYFNEFTDLYEGIPERKRKKYGLGGYGALEHSYCSMYHLPEIENETYLGETISDIAAHEFLHILTPLNLHSEEIADFDFRHPEMSQHLWMYEGVVEYFSHLTLVRHGVITPEQFLEKMREKIEGAEKFKPMSFTKMSEKIIKKKYQKSYLNVYQKGALFGFLLDLELTRLSDGKYGLAELMLELVNKYGKDKAFKDEDLIDEIVEMTYPEIRTFFDQYVIGKRKMPIDQFVDVVGWQYQPVGTRKVYSYGDFKFTYYSDIEKLIFVEVGENTLGAKDGDFLLKIGDTDVTIENAEDLLIPYLDSPSADMKFEVLVNRFGMEKKLSGLPKSTNETVTHLINENPNANEKQLRLRQFLLKGIK